MNNFRLKLLPEGREEQELILYQHKAESSIIDAVKSSSDYVFCDLRYEGNIIGENLDTITQFQLFINGVPISAELAPETGHITFNEYVFGSRIFTECYGFVQITIHFENSNGIQHLESNYIQVMVRKGAQNDSVRRMVEYVHKHNSTLLYGNKVFPKSSAGFDANAYRTIESKLILLQQIGLVFEDTYKYFQTNSRYTTIPQESIDRFEKLQYVSSRTVQYIVQHPEELNQTVGHSGIKVGINSYQPNKTLITNSVRSYDIYENRYIVGFLKMVSTEIERLEKEIICILSSVPNKPKETDNYITSSYFIYVNTAETLKITLTDLKALKLKFGKLLSAYSKVLPVKSVDVNAPPTPTPIFMSVPQYRYIYDCIMMWFKMGAFTLDEQKYMLSFIKASTLYEVYVLSKLISHLIDCHYELETAKKISYEFTSRSLYENTSCNNYYVFHKDNQKITVYYQPVIYNVDKSNISGIKLYRNTSTPFPRLLDDDFYRGKYYTPDFLIKYELDENSKAKYIIADAKFSTVDGVKKRQVACLAYKYLFSISPLNIEDQVIGLCIFNGQSENKDDEFHNIYDFETTKNPISPFASIVTLTENDESNKDNHSLLFNDLLEKYRNH